ncbi:MAG TPA: S41 family peptidase [Allosphingosinicella sp.]|nr:S41 family peptidase [Allosphingosinicella sp.]
MKYALALLCLCLAALPARAQEAPPAPNWRERTLADVAAIDQAVRDIHPAAADPATPGFAADWAESVRTARRRAEEASDRAAWAGTLRILVNSLRDAHAVVSIAPQRPAPPLWWTGYAVEHIAGRWFLRPVDAPDAPAGELRLLRCGARPIDAVAASQLDLTVTNWWVTANRSIAGARLLVDGGNPFVRRLERCTVLVDGRREREIVFAWRQADAAAVASAVRPYQRRRTGEARFDLAWQADGSAWLSIPSFTDSQGNAALREAVRGALPRLRRAPYIVLDVRGNSGGNSQLGTALSAVLWGEGSLLPEPPPGQPKRWRASRQLIAAMRATRAAQSGNPELVAFVDAALPAIEAGLARGEALVVDPGVAADADRRRRPRARPARTGPVLVLTDGGCGSSCIMFVNEVRRMGARQIGDPTDRNTVYGEQWAMTRLPSGEADLYLPSAVYGWAERELGGGPPHAQWTGAATDEGGLRAFVAAEARSARRRAAPQ